MTDANNNTPVSKEAAEDPSEVEVHAEEQVPASSTKEISPTTDQNDHTHPPIVIEVDNNGQPRQFRLPHGSHWDILSNHNPWMYRDEGWTSQHWWNDWMWQDDDSHSFETLRKKPRTVHSLERLANLTRENLAAYLDERDPGVSVPLFEDPDSGDQYLLYLSPVLSLPMIKCTSATPAEVECARSLFLLQGRQQSVPSSAEAPAPSSLSCPPRYVVQLGSLYVRTTKLRNWNIVLDVEDEKLPMWLVASRQQLKDHIINAGLSEPAILPLPIFNGLLSDENADYDCARILDSVRHLGLGLDLDNPAAPAFKDVVNTIRDTRRIWDPIYSELPRSQLERYAANEPFDHEEPARWPADRNLEDKITARLPHEREMK